MSTCARCGSQLNDDCYEFAGQTLCEDCYIDRMATPRTCDPWAVYTAKRTTEQNKSIILTDVQKKIYDLIAKEGPIDMETVCSRLSISEEDFRNAFATLRHLELCRASKQGDRVVYTLFNK